LISSPRRRSSVDRNSEASSSFAADKANPAVSLSSLGVNVSETDITTTNNTLVRTPPEEQYQQKMSRVVKVASRFRAMVKFRTHSAQQARAGDAAEGEFVAFVLATSAGTAAAAAAGMSASSEEPSEKPKGTLGGGGGGATAVDEDGLGESADSVAAVKSLLRGRGALAAQRKQALDSMRAAVVRFSDGVRFGTSERYLLFVLKL